MTVSVVIEVTVEHRDGGDVNESWGESMACDNIEQALEEYASTAYGNDPAYKLTYSTPKLLSDA